MQSLGHLPDLEGVLGALRAVSGHRGQSALQPINGVPGLRRQPALASRRDRQASEPTETSLAAVFEDLERLVGQMTPGQARALLADARVRALLPQLYAIRAAFEYDLEVSSANAALSAADPAAAVDACVAAKIAMLPATFFEALSERRRLLFVGSGPFPTTAMALVRVLGRPVTCLDRDGAANALAARFVAASDMASAITILEGALERFDDLPRYDAVVGAFLLGVDIVPQALNAKSVLVEEIADQVALGTRMVLRTPRDAGALIYPAIELRQRDGYTISLDPATDGGPLPYDRPFVVIERHVNGGRYAH